MYKQNLVNPDDSPLLPLCTQEQAEEYALELRAHLLRDDSEEVQTALENDPVLREQATRFEVFQRIALNSEGVHTTTVRDNLTISNPGWPNTLCGLLSPEEGSLLRPMPKWAYLKPIMPDMSGKTVLDIGCNNGFFCFSFAEEMEAKKVTGVEALSVFYDTACWVKSLKALDSVTFRNSDILLDYTVEQHDIVYMNEVHAHMLDPLAGVIRAISLAKEYVVIDGAVDEARGLHMRLGAEVLEDDTVHYHAWLMSDELMLNLLFLCGIPPECVTRYKAPWATHICYVIDVRNAEQKRNEMHVLPLVAPLSNTKPTVSD